MQRIDTSTAVAALPAPSPTSTPGYFQGGNPQAGQAPTTLSPDWCNSIQEEILSVLTAANIAPNKLAYNQLLQAIQKIATGEVMIGSASTTEAGTVELTTRADLIAGTDAAKAATADAIAQAAQSGCWWYGADTGPVNQLAVALTPTPDAQLPTGSHLFVKVAQTNTGACTLGTNGGPGAPISYQGIALTAGQLRAGQVYIFSWDGGAWELISVPTDPNGVKIRKYGSFQLPATGGTVSQATVNFPGGGFPNGCDHINLTCVGRLNGGGAGNPTLTLQGLPSSTQFTAIADSNTGELPTGEQFSFTTAITVTFEAIGH